MITFNTEQVTKNTTSKDLEALNAGCPEVKLQEKSVEYTQNAEYVVSPDAGYDGLSKVNVSVDLVVPTVQNSKTVNITKNGSTTVKPDTNYDVVEQVVVNTNIPLQEKQVDVLLSEPTTVILPDTGYTGITKLTVNHSPVEANTAYTATNNGNYTIHPSEGYDATTSVNLTVNVPATPVEPTKQVTITSNGTTNIIPADGYDAIEGVDVTVNVPSKEEETKSVSYTSNGSYTVQPTEGKTLSEVSVSVNVTNPPTAYDISNKFVNCVNQTISQSDIDAFTGWENLTDGSYKFYLAKTLYSNTPITLPAIPKLSNGSHMFSFAVPAPIISFAGRKINVNNGDNMFYQANIIVDEEFQFTCSSGGQYFGRATIDGKFGPNAFYNAYTNSTLHTYSRIFENATFKSPTQSFLLKGTDFLGMFSSVKGIQDMTVTIDASSSITILEMFRGISSLTALHLTFPEVEINNGDSSYYSPFYGLINLENLTINRITNSCYFSDCTKLTQESVNNIINALADGVTNQTIWFASTQYGYVTEEQKTAATAKGWTINRA